MFTFVGKVVPKLPRWLTNSSLHHIASAAPTSADNFSEICAAIGQRARCCTLPLVSNSYYLPSPHSLLSRFACPHYRRGQDQRSRLTRPPLRSSTRESFAARPPELPTEYLLNELEWPGQDGIIGEDSNNYGSNRSRTHVTIRFTMYSWKVGVWISVYY